MKRKLLSAVAASGLVLSLAACGGGSEGGSGDAIKIGVVTSTSGPLGFFGTEWQKGLEAGIDYATKGSNKVDGRAIELVTKDDAGDPDKALSAATDLAGQGVKIFTGTAGSAIALRLADFAETNEVLYITGEANSDDITGINDYTFRSHNQASNDLAAFREGLKDELPGSRLAVFGQDEAYGQSVAAATEKLLAPDVDSSVQVLAPYDAKDLTPYVQKLRQEDPDIAAFFWAGDNTKVVATMAQQNVFQDTIVTAVLAARSTWGPFTTLDQKNLRMLASYVPGAIDNPAAKALDTYLEETGEPIELAPADGFMAGQMIVQALKEGSTDDVESMIDAIEGFSFTSPRGETTIREEDHAILAPLYLVSFKDKTEEMVIEQTLDAEAIAPPLTKK